MKFVTDRPLADPDVAARKLVEIASTIEVMQDGSIRRDGSCSHDPYKNRLGDS